MSRRARDSEYDGWNIKGDAMDDWSFVGTVNDGTTPVFYDNQAGNLHRGRIDQQNERLVPDEEPFQELDPEQELGEALEAVGDELGWSGLSAFAREHLESDEK